ncbi:MAG: hypothetical protein WAX77_15015 [Methylococcaceae bacterium]
MNNTTHIPDFLDKSFDGMLAWFSEMALRNLIFHPDDAPESIISIITNESTFTDAECQKLNTIIAEMFEQFNNAVYDAAYPSFMKSMAIPLDA